MKYYFICTLLLISTLSPRLLSQETPVKANYDYDDLMYGPLYQFQYFGQNQHPFFIYDKPIKSDLVYKGNSYKNVHIFYDVYQQELVLFQEIDPKLPRYICLNPSYIKSWSLKNNGIEYVFRHLLAYRDKLPEKPILFSMHHDGQLKFFSSVIKEYEKDPYGSNSEFEIQEKYYLIKEDELFPVRNRRTLLKALDDEREKMKEYIRSNKLRLRLSRIDHIITLIKYYEELKTPVN